MTIVNNMFGVADHNNLGAGTHVGSLILVNVGHSAWQGVGAYGDNSWASPDTFGTSQAFYLENNTFSNGEGTDTDSYPNGGARFVCRFNVVNGSDNGVCYIHGTDTTQRMRGGRQEESYFNALNACIGGTCDTLAEFRSGVGMIFGNTAKTSGAYLNTFAKLDAQRSWRQDTPWGNCDGSSPWDTNGGTTYHTGTIGAVSGIGTGNWTVTDSGSVGWKTSQWNNGTGTPYGFHDVTQNYGVTILSNTSNAFSLINVNEGNVSFRPAVGDSYTILRASVCMDQPTRSGGNLVQNNASGNPVLASTGNPGAVNESLDPTYEWNDSGLPSGKAAVGAAEPFMIANRDFYSETPGQTAQTSPTSPFNGTSGTGWGTLGNRPTTCTPYVGYFATDQGSWNQSGGSNPVSYSGQGELFVCTATNTWTPYYTPYTYPHPLITGTDENLSPNTPSPPTSLTITVH